MRRAVALQRDHPVLQRTAFLTGSGNPPDIAWYDREGRPMTPARWDDPATRFLAFLLAGDRAAAPDTDLLALLNSGADAVDFPVPGRPGAVYEVVLDTTAPDGAPAASATLKTGDVCTVPARTVWVATAGLPGS